MKNKMITGAIIVIILLSAAVLFWYFSPSDVSIAKVEASKELLIGQLGQLTIIMQNNASKGVNVTIDVKNSFVDAKGVSLKGVAVLAYENLSYTSPNASNATDTSQKDVLLKPGSNSITYMVGYESPGLQKVEVEISQYGKLIDSRTVEINIPTPRIAMNIWNQTSINGTNEIYTVYGDLEIFGQGYAPGVVVNISVINELTNTTVSRISRKYSLSTQYASYGSEQLVVWETRKSISDPATGMLTTINTETFAPIVVIELSKGNPSDEKYILSPIAIKGKTGDRYRVIATARWMDQVVSSELRIPPEDEKVVLKVNPVMDNNPLEGFTGKSEGMFTVLKGSIPEVKNSLNGIIVKKAAQLSTFSFNDTLNFVVFRGVFPTGGYGINIDRVEKQGNKYTVYATYRDPGKGVGVTAAFTQPAAIIPIGRLPAGDYKAVLKVTKVVDNANGTKIIREVIETEKELGGFNFRVKPPEEGETSTTQTQKTNFDMNGTIENITVPCPFNVQCNPQYWLDAEDGNTYNLHFSPGARLPNFGQHIEVIGIETNDTNSGISK